MRDCVIMVDCDAAPTHARAHRHSRNAVDPRPHAAVAGIKPHRLGQPKGHDAAQCLHPPPTPRFHPPPPSPSLPPTASLWLHLGTGDTVVAVANTEWPQRSRTTDGGAGLREVCRRRLQAKWHWREPLGRETRRGG